MTASNLKFYLYDQYANTKKKIFDDTRDLKFSNLVNNIFNAHNVPIYVYIRIIRINVYKYTIMAWYGSVCICIQQDSGRVYITYRKKSY